MTKKSLTFAMTGLAALAAAPAHALTVGEAKVLSFTDQPLRVLIPIKAQPWEWKAMWASAQTYQKGLGLIATLYKPHGEKQDGFIEIRSKNTVTEPIIDLQITFDTGNRTTVHRTPILLDQQEMVTPQQYKPSTLTSNGNTITTQQPTIALPPPTIQGNANVNSDIPEYIAPPALAPESIKSSSYVTPKNYIPNSVRSSQAVVPENTQKELPTLIVSDELTKLQNSSKYEVQRGDTLYKIAKQHKPESMSMEAAMASIFEKNLHAFKGSSYKTLQAGATLNMSFDGSFKAEKEIQKNTVKEKSYTEKTLLKNDDGDYKEASEEDIQAALLKQRRVQLQKELKSMDGIKRK